MSKSILSFFQKASEAESSTKRTVVSTNDVNSVNTKDIEIPVNTVNNIQHNLVSEPLNNEGPSCHLSQFHPDNSFKFPVSTFGNRERHCQYKWFQEFKWLHYDAKKDCVFCYWCKKTF